MELVDWEKGKLHFVGLAGSGMAPLAGFLRAEGFEVQGSDRRFGEGVEASFVERGMACFAQDGSGLVGQNVFALCVSTAVEMDNPDILQAQALNLPIFHRSEVLAWVISRYRTIAVAGTSGKSTTTALLHHLLQKAGEEASLITGAPLESLPSPGNYYVGKSPFLVVEVDESDGSLVEHHPEIGLLLNIDRDHKELDELEEMFKTFRSHCKRVIVNTDEERCRKLSQNQVWDFGQDPNAGMRLQYQGESDWGTFFSYQNHEYTLPLPGKHNLSNLAAASAVLRYLGLDYRKAWEELVSFKGVWRRAQVRLVQKDFWIIDDFAHNPVKIKAMLQTAQKRTPKLFSWFQPHGFGPAKFMKAELAEVLAEVLRPNDVFAFGEIYYAGGTVNKDISSEELAEFCQKTPGTVEVCSKADLEARVREFGMQNTGLLLMGARDPELQGFSEELAKNLHTDD